MRVATILLAAFALAVPAGAQTAADYSRYSGYTAPHPQGQKKGGLRVFLLSGLKSHGPGAHDYPRWLDSWSKLLTERGAVVDGALSFPSAAAAWSRCTTPCAARSLPTWRRWWAPARSMARSTTPGPRR